MSPTSNHTVSGPFCLPFLQSHQDPTCTSLSQAMLYFKGYHAIQAQRIANALWRRGQRVMALALQSRISEVSFCTLQVYLQAPGQLSRFHLDNVSCC